jgi:hypothetical protein
VVASDHRDTSRTARPWIPQHGEAATAKAREMVEKMSRTGKGCRHMALTIVAIGMLGTPSTDAGQNSESNLHVLAGGSDGERSTCPRTRLHYLSS